jgi:hypothetical protein
VASDLFRTNARASSSSLGASTSPSGQSLSFPKSTKKELQLRAGSAFVEAVPYPCLEGCGLWANCASRGQRTQLQWRLGRLHRRFGSGFSVAGGADPGRGSERFSECFFARGRRLNRKLRVLNTVFPGGFTKTLVINHKGHKEHKIWVCQK